MELSEQNVAEYLYAAGRAERPPEGAGQEKLLLVQLLAGGVASVVLKVFDPNAGAAVGTDLRSPAQVKRGVADKRMHQGASMVLKQPLGEFKTAAEWKVDVDRVLVERDCLQLLGELLPAGSVPDLLWFDEANNVLAISCAPVGAVIWKKHLFSGRISSDAANHAGVLLAMMHSATIHDEKVQARYGDDRLFIQQRTDPYFATLFEKYPAERPVLEAVIQELLTAKLCLIHGDYSPKNIFLVPPPHEELEGGVGEGSGQRAKVRLALSHLMLLDFEVAYYGHPAFDVATLINHLLLKAFFLGKPWRALMIAIDSFWQTYYHSVDLTLQKNVEAAVGRMLGALLLARVDGKSPAEYLLDNEPVRARIRSCGQEILRLERPTLETALEVVAGALEQVES